MTAQNEPGHGVNCTERVGDVNRVMAARRLYGARFRAPYSDSRRWGPSAKPP